MALLRGFKNLSALRQNAFGLAVVTLARRDVAQGAVPVLIVVPLGELLDPVLCLGQRGEAVGGESRPVLQCLEGRLGEGVVVADPWPAVRRGDAQVVELLQEGRRLHRAAVIGMQNQRLVTIGEVLSPASLLDQLGGQLAGLGFIDLVPNDLAAEDVHDQVKVPPSTASRTR